MRKAEQRLWDTVRRNTPRGAWVQRIENLLDPGIPDALIMRDGRTVWAELKAPSRPVRDTSLLIRKGDVRTSQINWMIKATNRGAATYLLLRDDEGKLYFIPGRHARQFTKMTVEECRALSVANTWKAIWELI